jgi:hypothetical protein
MATLAAVRDALKVRLDTVTDLTAYDDIPDTILPPCAFPHPVSGDPHTTFSGRGSFFFDIVVIGAAIDQGLIHAQGILDGFLDLSGANSIIGAIEGDETLGGSAECILNPAWSDYGEVEIGEIKYLGAVLRIEVCVTT